MLAAAAVPPRPLHAWQAPADSIEVKKVEFVGAEAFNDDLLASAIVTAPTRCIALPVLCWMDIGVDRQYFDPLAIGGDVVRLRVFYYQRGYRDAVVTADTARAGSSMRVTFRVREGSPVRVESIDFQSEQPVPSQVMRNLPLVRGAALSLVAYEAARDTIISRLNNHGYALADVLAGYAIPRDSPYVAHVNYELIPGQRARFGSIEVAGAEKVSPAVVRRMLTFHTGDVYARDAVLRSQRNLFAQELFRHAEIREALSPLSDTLVEVRVQVNEGNLHRVRTGLGLSTAEYLNAEGRWISRSFLGGARRLELRGRIANLMASTLGSTPVFEPCTSIYCRLSGSLAVDFAQPWFFGPLNTFGTGVYVERRTLPDVFVRSATGGYVSFSRSLGPAESISLGFRPELTKLETAEGDLIFCFGFIACGPEEIETLRSARWLSPIALSYARDRSNSIFAPTRGHVLRMDAEYAGMPTGSDFGYTRVVGEITDYSPVGNGLVLAARLRSGWANAIGAGDSTLRVHPQKRFFAGGPNSVRGFAQYRLGPKVLTVDAVDWLARPEEDGGAGCTAQEINSGTCAADALAADSPDAFTVRPIGGAALLEGNVELRFPVFRDRVRGAAFLDFGQAWAEPAAANLAGVAWTPGLGVRYFSAVGPIRVDVGYNPQGGERVSIVTSEVEYCPDDPPQSECEPIRDGMVYDWRLLRETRVLRALEPVRWNPRQSFLDRLQLHFSIGQAF